MNYVHLNRMERDKSELEFLIAFGFIPLVSFFDDDNSDGIVGAKIFYNDKKTDTSIDLSFVLDYYNRVGEDVNEITSYCGQLEKQLCAIIKSGDILISGNCGEWASRAMHEICNSIGAKFWYYESFMFKGSFQLTRKPLMTSKYGLPELNEMVDQVVEAKDFFYYSEYLDKRITKYDQPTLLPKHDTYDGFIVGQLTGDTNLTQVNSEFKTTDDLAWIVAGNNPEKRYIYKVHPFMSAFDKKLYDLKNLEIVSDVSIHEIFDRCLDVHTISSTVGLEAGMYGKRVHWYSDTAYSQFIMDKITSRALFYKKASKYAIYREDKEKIKERLGI